MGLAIGAGFYEGALMACFVIFLTSASFTRLDRVILTTARTMNIYVEFSQTDDIQQILMTLREKNMRIVDIEITKMKSDRDIFPSAIFLVDMRKKVPHTEVIAAIAAIEGIHTVEEL